MRKFRSTFVSSTTPSWLSRLAAWLFPPRVRKERAKGVQAPPIYLETPPHVWLLRKRGKEAQQLLNRYCDGWPTSRRAWVKAGHKDAEWRRARAILLNAGIINQEGELLYTKRDAQRRLESELDKAEQKCWQRGCYIAPY